MVQLLPYLLGALSLFCLVIVAKPDLFRNWTVRVSDGDDRSWDDRRVRLGGLPRGVVRAIYLGVAVLLAVFAFQVHGWAAAEDDCALAEQVYSAAQDGWDLDRAYAEAARLGLDVEAVTSKTKSAKITSVTVSKDGRTIATWRTGSVSTGLDCR
ncbi:hypothetical protein [Microlunatus sp. GCM10028923]|uniref:hypothetical protein n=1 Tax=Microlunatus sp. GCM10028923 TaxID=3273400 RepID=UPI00360E89A2